MKTLAMPTLTIGNLNLKKPIIQGGMGVGISLSGLASAVADEGGVGVIAAAGIGMLEPDFRGDVAAANERALRREIRAARQKTDGIIGVNIMIALSDYKTLLRSALDEGADMIFMGAGLPLDIPNVIDPGQIRNGSARIIPIVSSARAAGIILRSWSRKQCFPAALVVEGPMAGGHLGFKREQLGDPDFSLQRLLPAVLEVTRTYEREFRVSIPVIAAGGIYTGGDIKEFLAMGAGGVQMATRFVTTEECDADIRFKESYIAAERDDMVIIDSPVGLPGRAVKNGFLRDVSEGRKKPFTCTWKCLRTCNFRKVSYCIAGALTNAKLGDLEGGFVFGGANAFKAKAITSVRDVFESLMAEYTQYAGAAV
ncbi:nitronate monooxygenase [bacterium]|nr:nitronate monooxygenase [bacterium]